jgi:hypothetical protein
MKIIVTEEQLENIIRKSLKKTPINKFIKKQKIKKPIGKFNMSLPIMGELELEEKWSEKYKKSINCNNPKGFSQRAHCQGRKKRLKESEMDDGYDLEKIKKGLKILSQISETFGEFIPLQFKLYGYQIKRGGGLKIMVLFIDVDSEDGVYDPPSGILYDISQQLLEIFQMIGIRDERYMNPAYDFKFNKRPLDNIKIV